MSNRENKYINKDDYSLINNMSNTEISNEGKKVSTYYVQIIIWIIIIVLGIILFYFIYYFIRNWTEMSFIKIIIYIVFLLMIIQIFYFKFYISYKIAQFIENNLLFKI